MIDIQILREDPEKVRAGALLKCFPERAEAVDRAVAADMALRKLLPELEGMRATQKREAKSLGRLSPEEREVKLAEQKELKVQIQGVEEQERGLRESLQTALLQIPQLPDPEVPEGKEDTDNVQVRTWGDIPKFDFEPKAHYDIGEAHGWVDFKRAAEMAGSRNYMLIGDLALLHDAVLRFAMEHMVGKGFTAIDPPVLVRDTAMEGTGFFPGGEEQAYRCEKDGLNLIGTAEIPVTALHAGEILKADDLPKRYVARTGCFRREAGTHGKDTRGLYRVHQFQKVEQVILDVADKERSVAHHHAITKNSEEVLQALGLPYRVVLVCGGDLGAPPACKFDIECWMPSRNSWGETHSASRFYDYQARRLNIRYRGKEDKKPQICHTLNNTVVASPRILIPLLEIHQQADGTVKVPEPLRKFMGGREVLGL